MPFLHSGQSHISVDTLQELQRTNDKLKHVATTGPLTGARSSSASKRKSDARSTVERLSLDLDHFKAINDAHWHLAGDEVLCEFVQKWLDAIRPYDGVARVGARTSLINKRQRCWVLVSSQP